LCIRPIMVAYPEGVIYVNLKPEDIPELVEEHLIKGRILERLLYIGNPALDKNYSHHAGYSLPLLFRN